MFKDKYIVKRITQYENDVLSEDYIRIEKYDPSGKVLLGSFVVKTVNSPDLIELLSKYSK